MLHLQPVQLVVIIWLCNQTIFPELLFDPVEYYSSSVVIGMVPFERAFVISYRLSIVTFPLSLHVWEILPLLCSSTPLFPTQALISPKFPHVPRE